MNTFKILLGRISIVRERTEYLGGPIVIALALIGLVLRPGVMPIGQAAFALATAVALIVAFTSERDGARSLAWIAAAACWSGHGYQFVGSAEALVPLDWKVMAALALCFAMLMLPPAGLVLTSRRPPRPGVATTAEVVILVVALAEAYFVEGLLSLWFFGGAEPWWPRIVFLFIALPWAAAAWLRPERRIAYAAAALPHVCLAAFPTAIFATPTVYMWLAFGLPALGAAVQVARHLLRREREPVAAAEIPSGTLGEIDLPAPEWRA